MHRSRPHRVNRVLGPLMLVALLLACGPSASPGASAPAPKAASGQPAPAAPAQSAAFLQVHGEQFVRDLLSQDLVVTGDNQQITEWVVRGRYPIAIGVRSYDLLVFQQEGLGQNVKPVRTVEALPLSIGSGSIQPLSQAPHHAALKVFSNWLLTQRVQQSLSQATGDNSRRADVPPATPEGVPDRSHLDKYAAHQEEAMLPVRVRA